MKNLCHTHGVEFLSNIKEDDENLWKEFSKSKGDGEINPLRNKKNTFNSQAEARRRRFEFFRQTLEGQIKKASAGDRGWLVLAHHREDLMESRFIRLIRGTGGLGVSSMQVKNPPLLRPLLPLSRWELKNYLESKNEKWLEDPSNGKNVYLRNWLRNQWFPLLEDKRPGSLSSLGRSLEVLAQCINVNEQTHPRVFQCIQGGQIYVSDFLTLSPQEKTQALALYMKTQGVRDYGLSHIREILKRLDSSQKKLEFQLLGRLWQLDSGRLYAGPVSGSKNHI